jgi:hypothetical protein
MGLAPPRSFRYFAGAETPTLSHFATYGVCTVSAAQRCNLILHAHSAQHQKAMNSWKGLTTVLALADAPKPAELCDLSSVDSSVESSAVEQVATIVESSSGSSVRILQPQEKAGPGTPTFVAVWLGLQNRGSNLHTAVVGDVLQHFANEVVENTRSGIPLSLPSRDIFLSSRLPYCLPPSPPQAHLRTYCGLLSPALRLQRLWLPTV